MTIPTTADAFKVWADRECAGDRGAWPAPLQKLAFYAWHGLLQGDDTEYRKFLTAHDEHSLRRLTETYT